MVQLDQGAARPRGLPADCCCRCTTKWCCRRAPTPSDTVLATVKRVMENAVRLRVPGGGQPVGSELVETSDLKK